MSTNQLQNQDDAQEDDDAETRRKPSAGRRIVGIAKRVGILYLAYCSLLFACQRWLIFPDFVAPEPSQREKYDVSTHVLTRDIGNGELVVAWFVPCADARAGKPSPLVVYFHGNAEIIDSQGDNIERYRQLGCSVLLPEYRGYGRSAGQPSQRAIVDDAACFVAEAIKRADVDPQRVFYHGRSLGGGVAAQLALLHKPRVLILGSSFTSLRPFARRYLAPSFLVRSPFDTDKALPELDIPILIQHGTNDDIVPVSHGRALKALARDVTYIEYDCRHNDFPGDANEDQYTQDIRDFLTKNGILP